MFMILFGAVVVGLYALWLFTRPYKITEMDRLSFSAPENPDGPPLASGADRAVLSSLGPGGGNFMGSLVPGADFVTRLSIADGDYGAAAMALSDTDPDAAFTLMVAAMDTSLNPDPDH